MTASVIGLGNRLRRDDGIGPAVATGVAKLAPRGVRVLLAADDPAELIAAWTGADLAVVIDAAVVDTDDGEDSAPGRIHRWTPAVGHPPPTVSTHALDLAATHALAQILGCAPTRLVVLAVEAADVTFGDGLSPALAAAVPDVVSAVLSELGRPSA